MPLIYKPCSKILMFQNYLAKCHYFLNLILTKSSYMYIFKWKFHLNFQKHLSGKICIASTCNSIFKNMGILLNSFETEAFCCIVYKLGPNTHFPPFYVSSTIGNNSCTSRDSKIFTSICAKFMFILV